MTKKIFFTICLLAILAGCQKKSIPVITERQDKTEVPAIRTVNETIAPDTLAGKTIFIARCSRCHDLPLPDQYSASRWEGILSYMMPRARLTKEEQVHITAYLKAHAAK